MVESVTEILTGGLVLVIAVWLIPLQLSYRKLRRELNELKQELSKLREEEV
ncbi:MAG: hypothetical protein KAJ55_00410 [Anaerolineales bacterium]|nr:hypothetical protein [Anaerolineales bacterium]